MREATRLSKESEAVSTKKPKPAEDSHYCDREGIQVREEDRAEEDFSDHSLEEKKHACLVFGGNSLIKVRVECFKGSKAMVSVRESQSKEWSELVKLNQLVGDYDGEKRVRRVGLLKIKNFRNPTLVTVLGISEHCCDIKPLT